MITVSVELAEPSVPGRVRIEADGRALEMLGGQLKTILATAFVGAPRAPFDAREVHRLAYGTPIAGSPAERRARAAKVRVLVHNLRRTLTKAFGDRGWLRFDHRLGGWTLLPVEPAPHGASPGVPHAPL